MSPVKVKKEGVWNHVTPQHKEVGNEISPSSRYQFNFPHIQMASRNDMAGVMAAHQLASMYPASLGRISDARVLIDPTTSAIEDNVHNAYDVSKNQHLTYYKYPTVSDPFSLPVGGNVIKDTGTYVLTYIDVALWWVQLGVKMIDAQARHEVRGEMIIDMHDFSLMIFQAYENLGERFGWSRKLDDILTNSSLANIKTTSSHTIQKNSTKSKKKVQIKAKKLIKSNKKTK